MIRVSTLFLALSCCLGTWCACSEAPIERRPAYTAAFDPATSIQEVIALLEQVRREGEGEAGGDGERSNAALLNAFNAALGNHFYSKTTTTTAATTTTK